MDRCKKIHGDKALLIETKVKALMRGVLAQGQTQGSTPRAHQQALTTVPFENTCEVDAVSPEVAIGGCRTQVSTTRRNAKWIQSNNT
jgi:hypothetical protein